MNLRIVPIVALSAVALAACGGGDEKAPAEDAADATQTAGADIVVTAAELAGNPFLEDWTTPYGVPPFDSIEDEHFMPAFKHGVLELRKEVAAITANTDAPTFDNTILALEKSGDALNNVVYPFSALTGTELNDALRALQREIWPMYSREIEQRFSRSRCLKAGR